MKSYTTSSCGIPLKFNGPESVEEYDKLAGKAGAIVEDAATAVIAWSTLPEWQEAFVKKLIDVTGSTRLVDEAATKKAKERAEDASKVKDVLEKETAYIKRAQATLKAGTPLTGVADIAAFNALAQEVADGIAIDPAPSKKSGKPKKDLLEKAQQILARDVDAREAKITEFLNSVPGFDLERTAEGVPSEESLARLIGKFLDARLNDL